MSAGNLQAALAAAATAPVFPVVLREGGRKVPAVKGWPEVATQDEATIRSWWTRWPRALIGMPTGKRSGVVAVDFDPGADVALLLAHEFDGARVHQTKRGLHYLFALPPGAAIHNSQGTLGAHIDVRGTGGFIIRWDAHGHEARGPSIDALPLLPDSLRVLMERKPAPAALPAPAPTSADTARVREGLFLESADVPEGEWVGTLMRLHQAALDGHLSMDDALALADDWSATAPERYTGRQSIETRFASWTANPKDAPLRFSWLRSEPAADSEFRDLRSEVDAPVAAIVPRAVFDCTDQANAGRLQDAAAGRLVSVAKSFYEWTGTHWQRDDQLAARLAAGLSRRVSAEAKAAKAKAEAACKGFTSAAVRDALRHPAQCSMRDTPEGEAAFQLAKRADELAKWAKRCEDGKVQAAAVRMLRDLVRLDAGHLDRDPWLLNCRNGAIDLRTGELREHALGDFITRCAPVAFDPTATAPRFERFVREIVADEPTARFLKRWLGYCITGSVREHALALLVGPGANGKSTLLEAIEAVLGEYAGTAAPGLLTGSNNDHPTGLADLHGRRLVSASESDEGALLREGTVKAITGGDRIKARRMRCDYFEFSPTHKLQLLTNHRPVVRGSDHGIWRRILLIDFPYRFGSAEAVAAGQADRPRDPLLVETLRAERPGILRWLVEGAAEWHRDGLNPPDAVRAAVEVYREEQDRVGQFIKECCEVGAQHWAPISGLGGLYPEYDSWCRENGYHALGRGRFLEEVLRAVPGARRDERKLKTSSGRRSTVRGVAGLRLAECAT